LVNLVTQCIKGGGYVQFIAYMWAFQ